MVPRPIQNPFLPADSAEDPVFTPLKATGIGLVATLVTSEGARLSDRTSEKSLEKTEGDGDADGGNAEEEPAREDGKKPAQEAEEQEAEWNPLLEFMLDLDGLLRLQNRRLIESLLQSAADGLAATRMAKPRDGDPGGREPNADVPNDDPRPAAPPAASGRGDDQRDLWEPADPPAPGPSENNADAVPAARSPTLPARGVGVSDDGAAILSRPTLRPPEAVDERRSWALIELFRAGLAFLRAG
jgi:hypothetical protein